MELYEPLKRDGWAKLRSSSWDKQYRDAVLIIGAILTSLNNKVDILIYGNGLSVQTYLNNVTKCGALPQIKKNQFKCQMGAYWSIFRL